MSATAPVPHRRPGAGVLDPFNFAAYITWAAVAAHPMLHFLRGPEWDAPHPHLALLGMGGMLALFLLRAELDAREAGPALLRAAVLGQIAAALLACWAGGDELTPALLVITAAQTAVVFPARIAVLVLLGVNALLALVPYQIPEGVATLLIAYAGFQAYTAVGAHYGYRIYAAREDALRINAQLMATRSLLEEGTRADERLRLSRDLHDLAGHKLTALKMQLSLLRRQAEGTDTSALAGCERLADELLADIRGVVTVLRPHEGVDLPTALRALDPGLPRPKVVFNIDPEVRVADMRSAEVLLRCAQEGLTNVLRHSAATAVTVSLTRTPRGLLLSIADDGKGRAARVSAGNGLQGLRERLTEAGGRLEIGDCAPQGLALRALLPEKGSEAATVNRPAPSVMETLEALHTRYCPWAKSAASAASGLTG